MHCRTKHLVGSCNCNVCMQMQLQREYKFERPAARFSHHHCIADSQRSLFFSLPILNLSKTLIESVWNSPKPSWSCSVLYICFVQDNFSETMSTLSSHLQTISVFLGYKKVGWTDVRFIYLFFFSLWFYLDLSNFFVIFYFSLCLFVTSLVRCLDLLWPS